MRKRSKKGVAEQPSAVEVLPPARTPAIAIAAAVVLAAALFSHLFLSDAPYPPDLRRLWVRVGDAIILACFVIADRPWKWIVDLPRRALAALLRPISTTFAIGVVAVAIAGSVAFSLYMFGRAPVTADEMAQLWHAKILLSGRFSLPADVNREFFAIDNIVDNGRWYSEYPIGGPAVLAVGRLIGVPWLINPILCGATAFMLYRWTRLVYTEGEARAASALFCITPVILMMSGSYMNHVPVLFFAVAALWMLAQWEKSATDKSAALLGACIGAMATIRPLDAVVFAACVGVFQLAAVSADKSRIRSLVIQCVAGVVAVSPALIANWRMTGHPFVFGYEALWGPQHGLGFHADPTGSMHTPARALEYATSYVSGLNVFAFMWPAPVLALVLLVLMTMKRVTRWDALLLALFAAQVGAYAMYWHNGQFIGPRFLYTALPTLVIFVARAPFIVGDRLGGYWRRALVATIIAFIVFSWTAAPHRFSVWGQARAIRSTRTAIKADVLKAVRESGIHNALVFFREPFGNRLVHRLWGLGMPRSEAASLVLTHDACSVLDAVRAAEKDSLSSRADRLALIDRMSVPFVPSDSMIRGQDFIVRINSQSSLTKQCMAEMDEDDSRGTAAFGPALIHEPIGPDGRIDGDVIYVADLGERNELLRARFGSRTWYRLTVVRPDDDDYGVPRIAAY